MKRFSSQFVCIVIIITSLTSCKVEPSNQETVAFKRTDNELIVRLEAEPPSLNPLLTTSNYATTVITQLFSYLLVPDLQTYEFLPLLVKDRAKVEDITTGPWAGGKTYEFEIHQEAVWDDNQPVTGHDFDFTMKAVMNPKVPAAVYRNVMSFIKEIQVDAENPKKFKVFAFPKMVSQEGYIASNLPVLPAHLYDPAGIMKKYSVADLVDPQKAEALAASNPDLQQFADEFTKPQYTHETTGISGSGPYKLESWTSGDQLILTKKENWWGESLVEEYPELGAYPDRIIFKIITNAATALAAIKAEEIDVVGNIAPKDFLEIEDSEALKEVYNLSTVVDMACYYLLLQTENPKLSDKRVRQALSHAIDVDDLLSKIYYNYGKRVIAPILPSSSSYNNNISPPAYDIDKAKSLLAEAGWRDTNNNGIVDKEIDGEVVELTLSYLISANREISRNSALLVKNSAQRAGINIEIVAKERAAVVGDMRSGNYELVASGQTVQYVPWEPIDRLHSKAIGGVNYTRFSNAEADEIMEQIQVTSIPAERDKLYHRLQEILVEEQPIIFYLEPLNRIAVHKRFDGEITSIRPGYMVNKFKIKNDLLSLKD